jgi:peptidyl-prolyl cis-trans isomerase D
MLDAMRKGAVNWFAKGLLGLLVVSFGVWGIGDYIRKIGHTYVARIGDTEISPDQYRQAYQDEMNALSRRFGRRLTPEQAKLFGVEQLALSRLVNSAAVDQQARDLNLSISDAGVIETIKKEPAFQGADGKFSPAIYQNFLRQSGMSEARFLRERHREEVRAQITETLGAGVMPAKSMIEQLHQYREETRVIEYIAPDFAKLIKLAPADDAKLREYYEQNKAQFVTPELRKINALLLTRASVAARTPINEDEVKALYEKNKAKIDIPEKRRIQQLVFKDRAAADQAYAELSKAKDFKEAAAKLGYKDADIDLGVFAKREVVDAKIAEAAFALKKDELSKPIEGEFAVVLVRVTEIVAGKQRTYDEVKADLRKQLADERANQEIQTLHDQVEEQRASGKPLKDIGSELKLDFREIAEIDSRGNTGAGKPALAGPESAAVGQAAFAGNIGIESEAAELADDGYAWVDVIGVTPEKQKDFDAVKTEVGAAVMEEQRRNEIASLSGKLADRIRKGESLDTIAKETGAKVQKTTPITRNLAPTGLTQGAVQQAFSLAKGGASSALTADGKSRIIFRVAEITPAPVATTEQAERIKAELTRQMQGEAMTAYFSALQKRYGLTVNEAMVRQVLGRGTDVD